MIKKINIIFLSLIIFSLCSCGMQESELAEEKPIVAVSIVPQETFVREIAGDFIQVVTLIPPGNSPANYAPKPKEIENLSEADIYFTIGVPTEKANILPKLNNINNDIKIIDLAAEVNKVYPQREFAPGKPDPHIWLSPKRVEIMINIITKELSKLDENNKTIYEENAQNYINQLASLDKQLQDTISQLTNKSFIIYHPSLGYFAEDYGLEMLAIEKEGKEATPKDIEKIIELAKAKNIKTIFYQSEIDSKQSQVIAEEIDGITKMIAPLDPDYINNLQTIADSFKELLK